MGFNNSIFLFGFLPLLLLVYRLTEVKRRNILLLLASLIFFAWGEPVFVFILIATTCADFYLVNWMSRHEGSRREDIMLLSLVMNGSLLFLFKYAGVLLGWKNNSGDDHSLYSWIMNMGVPIGISFFTFESVTYVVDVYRKEQAPADSLSDYFLYIFFFPKLVAGPIIRYRDFSPQLSPLTRNYEHSFALTGFYRMITGLGKKILVADQLKLYIVAPVFENGSFQDLHPVTAWVALFSATLMIYFDFSAYSDIAIGISRMLGFRIPENFDHPFLSRSITEFWQRWHISLGNWLRNYLYFPLGGSRKGIPRQYINLLIVFIACGLWHGASYNFLLWGSLYGLVIVAEKAAGKFFKGLPAISGMIYVLIVVMMANILFLTDTPSKSIEFARALFSSSQNSSVSFYAELWPSLVTGVILTWYMILPNEKIKSWLRVDEGMGLRRHYVWAAWCALVFVLSCIWMTASSYNSFIYFRF